MINVDDCITSIPFGVKGQSLSHTFYSHAIHFCRTPDQTKIKIRSNQKSGEAL